MNSTALISLFEKYKEKTLYHRYIHNDNIAPLLNKIDFPFDVEVLGASALNKPIFGVKIGSGQKRVLMWSQMHGNESTTTKALFDVFNTLKDSDDISITSILKNCTLYFIPILNPDGAFLYTRENANKIDLNRDAQDLSQPESVILRNTFNAFKPDFCFNLHGQRTIFSAGNKNNSATISFLAPAQDKACTITINRQVAMSLIARMHAILQDEIVNQVGIYDDSFNLNCVGDTFQSFGVPTVLFEAGHYANDYEREVTRKYIYVALMDVLLNISEDKSELSNHEDYFLIPENEKLFYDIIIRNANVGDKEHPKVLDLGINYVEELKSGRIVFTPTIKSINNLNGYFGHKEVDANGKIVLGENLLPLKKESENDFVYISNAKFSLKVI